MKITRYHSGAKARWDDFVQRSKNGTFLLQRDYMDYHADRFDDHSLIAEDDSGAMLALLPAHEASKTLASHQGLTYGGFVTDARMTTPQMLSLLGGVRDYMRTQGFTRLAYKTIPAIYSTLPAEEDRYALFRAGARLTRRDVLSVATASERLPYQKRRTRQIERAKKAGVLHAESHDYARFWGLLEENLRARFGVSPVHSVAEITRLAALFPAHIRLHLCCAGTKLLAGVVMYVSPRVAHAQYISASDEGKACGALDWLFAQLLDGVYASTPYFDFGISTEEGGARLNHGLIEQKEGFGARAVMHDHYELEIA